MNDLQIFNNPEFGEIRAVEIDGAPWFVGKDVAAALGYSDTAQAIRKHVDEEDKGVVEMTTPGGVQNIQIINESGVYSLIFSSKLPKAKKFKRWVTAEVLPAIRRTGAYIAPQAQVPATLDGAAMQAVTAAIDTLTATVQTLVQRMDAQGTGWGEMRAMPAPPDRNPFDDNPFSDSPHKPSSILARKMWMRLVNEKLDLLSMRYGKSNNAILHQIYQDIEAHFETVLNEERCRVMEEQGLEKCSVLLAIFFDPELRDYFQRDVDCHLAPENRGW